MPRTLRIQYPGAIYHVMSRGDRRERIYYDDVDRQDFLKTLAEACQKADLEVHSYCLMPKPLPSGARNAQREPGGGNALAIEQLHLAAQSPPPTHRPRF